MVTFIVGFVVGCVVASTVATVVAYFVVRSRVVRTARRLAGESAAALVGEARKFAGEALTEWRAESSRVDW